MTAIVTTSVISMRSKKIRSNVCEALRSTIPQEKHVVCDNITIEFFVAQAILIELRKIPLFSALQDEIEKLKENDPPDLMDLKIGSVEVFWNDRIGSYNSTFSLFSCKYNKMNK
jgi:hypothetical protein